MNKETECELNKMIKDINSNVNCTSILFIITFFVFIIVGAIFVIQGNKISDLEASVISVDGWVEVCEYETVEKHIIIENKEYNCKSFYLACEADVDCFIRYKAGEPLPVDWTYPNPYSSRVDDYIDCLHREEPYIYTETKDVCVSKMLVKYVGD